MEGAMPILLTQGTHMTTWPLISVMLLMLLPLMVLATSIQGWVQHFKTEGDIEY